MLTEFLYTDELDPPTSLKTLQLDGLPESKNEALVKTAYVQYSNEYKAKSKVGNFLTRLGKTVPCPFWYDRGKGRARQHTDYWGPYSESWAEFLKS